MGSLIYGVAPAVAIEDRVLRHLQVVIMQKLRRAEAFAFNWDQEPGVDGDTELEAEHGSVWISPGSQLYFRYDGPRQDIPLNRVWLEQLMQATYRAEGLSALPEPAEGRAPAGAS
ncbi:hypothetical protein [Naasia sp. SYSU D00057]|uniref:DUF7882 family protein n=1 Tax=Naasia sp. SYSU D00057 TaxID=2817380 RepID=UPI001B31473F|nr:hypothetical protein [Naasia sp. SYSU D00057]